MASTISYDALTCFVLLLFTFGLLFVAALWKRGKGRSPAGVIERADGRLPGQPDRTPNLVPGRLIETRPDCGPTRLRESDNTGLEGYARQFEEAIENIRLRRQDFRRGK
jgi:hypothetical protein